MGEKRAYKARKSGGGRKKLKPEHDAGKNLKEQMESAVALYNSEMSLQAIGDALNLNPIKVRKLLITAGVQRRYKIPLGSIEKPRITKPPFSQLQILFSFPEPPSPHICPMRRVCIFRQRKETKSAWAQNGSGDTGR